MSEQSPLRILFVLSSYPPAKNAGMETACQRLGVELIARGHQVTVLTQAVDGLPPEQDEAPGVRVVRTLRPLAVGPLWGVTYMQQVARESRRLAPRWDVAMAHKLYLHSLPLNRVCRALGRPALHLLVNAGPFSDLTVLRRHRLGEILLRRAIAGATGFFVLSSESGAELLAYGVDPSRIRDYRNFVDATKFSPAVAPRGGHLLYLGRFHEQKNLPLLIDAFEDLGNDAPELRLVGGGDTHAAVEARVAGSPQRARIAMAGWTANPAAEFAGAMATVTATRAEGLSNALLEAMTCGTPVITTDVSGARDALDPGGRAPAIIPAGTWFVGEGGLIVPCDDRAALAGAMRLLATDPALRQQLGERARERILTEFVADVVVPRYVADCRDFLAKVNAP